MGFPSIPSERRAHCLLLRSPILTMCLSLAFPAGTERVHPAGLHSDSTGTPIGFLLAPRASPYPQFANGVFQGVRHPLRTPICDSMPFSYRKFRAAKRGYCPRWLQNKLRSGCRLRPRHGYPDRSRGGEPGGLRTTEGGRRSAALRRQVSLSPDSLPVFSNVFPACPHICSNFLKFFRKSGFFPSPPTGLAKLERGFLKKIPGGTATTEISTGSSASGREREPDRAARGW